MLRNPKLKFAIDSSISCYLVKLNESRCRTIQSKPPTSLPARSQQPNRIYRNHRYEWVTGNESFEESLRFAPPTCFQQPGRRNLTTTLNGLMYHHPHKKSCLSWLRSLCCRKALPLSISCSCIPGDQTLDIWLS